MGFPRKKSALFGLNISPQLLDSDQANGQQQTRPIANELDKQESRQCCKAAFDDLHFFIGFFPGKVF